MGEPAWPDAKERARLLAEAARVYDAVDGDTEVIAPKPDDITMICVMLVRLAGLRPNGD